MRELDTKLAELGPPDKRRSRANPDERAFWEFADLEYDAESRSMRIVGHYVQRPDFPHLFAHLAGSPPIRRIADQIGGKDRLRIHKQPWRARECYETEIGANNVIYMLADCDNRLFYVGEAGDMVARFRRGQPLDEYQRPHL